MRKSLLIFMFLMALSVLPAAAIAQTGPEVPDEDAATTESPMALESNLSAGFYYQGVLSEGGVPVNGTRDIRFQLYDDAVAGNQVGGTITLPAVAVLNGRFQVFLGWSSAILNGQNRWLRVEAKDSGGIYRDLGRQKIAAVPYAMSLYPGAAISGTTGSDIGILNIRNTGTEGDGIKIEAAQDGLDVTVTGTGSGDSAIEGTATGVAGNARGGYFYSRSGQGIYVESDGDVGLYARSDGGYGIFAQSTVTHALVARGPSTPETPVFYAGYFVGDSGIYAEEEDDGGSDWAGYFKGDVEVTGFLKSPEDTVIYLSLYSARPDSASPLTIQFQDEGNIFVNQAAGSGERTLIIPVDLPAMLYGVSTKIKAVQVCYDLSNTGSFITRTRVQEWPDPGGPLDTIIDDNTDRTSITDVCYTAIDAVPEIVRGTVTVRLTLNFRAEATFPGDIVVINSVRLALTE
ncbi:MAG: hypothetical protein IT330_00480 [Anaerolineae bacterium]|nr:hypothetical protein [Anaerolineae bacterium]